MPTLPNEVDYTVDFGSDSRAKLGISGVPNNSTITVAWNGTPVYGPTTANQPGQSDIDVGYTAGAGNTLRVNLEDGGAETYSKSGIAGQPGGSSSGQAPKI